MPTSIRTSAILPLQYPRASKLPKPVSFGEARFAGAGDGLPSPGLFQSDYYDTVSYLPGRNRPDPYLMEWMKQCVKPGDTVLELGCNSGNNLLPLAKRGAHAYGVDISQTCIDELLDTAGFLGMGKNVQAKVWDFGGGQLPPEWDHLKGNLKAINAVHVFSHFSDRALIDTVQRFSDYLAPGGIFVASIIAPEQSEGQSKSRIPSGDYDYLNHRDLESDVTDLQAGFQSHSQSVVNAAFGKLEKVEERKFQRKENGYWILPESRLRWVVYRKPDGTSCSPVKWLSSFWASGSGKQ